VLPLLGTQGMNLAGSINGQPVMMALNTGLGLTALLPATAQRLSLSTDPMRQSSFAASTGPITRRTCWSAA
jgi:predicted aspartyl protease